MKAAALPPIFRNAFGMPKNFVPEHWEMVAHPTICLWHEQHPDDPRSNCRCKIVFEMTRR